MVRRQNLEREPSSKLSNSSVLTGSTPTGSPLAHSSVEFHFISLFPELFEPVLNSSLLGKAQKKGVVSYYLTQLRDFALSKHRTVDEPPFGGGEGMLLKPDVLYAAWESIQESTRKTHLAVNQFSFKSATVLLSPQGELFTQEVAKELAGYSQLILVCGHYEGVDERFVDLCVDREISIGDYVLTGGELPALVVADAVTRLLPGVVGNERSISEDSLENGLLKYPQYTRPREFQGLKVPDLLLQGDHGAIQTWREEQMRRRTQKKRPDLWEKFNLKTQPKK